MELCRASLPQGLTPLSLASRDSRSVLAVKGPLRRFAPWTAPGRSGETRCSRGKRGISGRVDGSKGSLSAIPAALSRSRGAAITRRAVAQRRSRASGLTRPWAEAIRGFDSGFGLGFVVGPLARSAAVWCKSFVLSSLPIRKVLVLPFRGGALAPLLGVLSFVFSELSTGLSLLLLVLYYLFCTTC